MGNSRRRHGMAGGASAISKHQPAIGASPSVIAGSGAGAHLIVRSAAEFRAVALWRHNRQRGVIIENRARRRQNQSSGKMTIAQMAIATNHQSLPRSPRRRQPRDWQSSRRRHHGENISCGGAIGIANSIGDLSRRRVMANMVTQTRLNKK